MPISDAPAQPVRSPLRHLNPPALRDAVRQETRARQRHLPPISVYRWWARRTESVTGAIVDAVDADRPGRLTIADPFAGGGVIALATLLRGHRIYAQDVNPWAARSLATMLTLPAPYDLAAAGERLHAAVQGTLTRAYATELSDGTPAAISHTLRVATGPCPGCAATLKLFPSAIVSLRTRVDAGGVDGYIACPAGHVHLAPTTERTSCQTCRRYVYPQARYTTGRAARCTSCNWTGKIAEIAGDGGFTWQIALVERFGDGRREISLPTAAEVAQANSGWEPTLVLPVIEAGIETPVLLRYGMHCWHDLYPARQRVVIEELLHHCTAAGDDDQTAHALEAAIIGSTEMAGYASRWDPRYLKAYEAVANHRLNVTTLAAEPNVWGAADSGRGTVTRRLDHFAKAAVWLEERIGRTLVVDGGRESNERPTPIAQGVDARIVAGGSQRLIMPAGTLDAVITDPPYHDDVHYGELSNLFRSWAGQATRHLDEDVIVRRSTGPVGTNAYQKMLTGIFTEVRRSLKDDGHLILSYANREPGAWVALISALQTSGFRAAGYTVVHSENEVDHAKAGKRACTLDILIDVVSDSRATIRQHRPAGTPHSDEEAFCRIVGRYALRIGALDGDWAQRLTSELRESRFLQPASSC